MNAYGTALNDTNYRLWVPKLYQRKLSQAFLSSNLCIGNNETKIFSIMNRELSEKNATEPWHAFYLKHLCLRPFLEEHNVLKIVQIVALCGLTALVWPRWEQNAKRLFHASDSTAPSTLRITFDNLSRVWAHFQTVYWPGSRNNQPPASQIYHFIKEIHL